MKRRDFLASCAAAVGGLAIPSIARAKDTPAIGPLAGSGLRIAVQPRLFKGSMEEQLEQVAAWGCAAYEWLRPEGDLEAIRRKADAVGLEISCIIGAGWIGEGGMTNPADHDRIEAQFHENIQKAKALGCKRLVGLTGNERNDVTREAQTEHIIRCVKRLVPIAEGAGVTIVMEPLNVLVNHAGYFLTRTDKVVELLNAVGNPHVKILFDIYHQQITEGNVIRNIQNNIEHIGHFHVADNPGRHEPGTGELNYANILKAIAETGYDGFVAMEFGPLHDTETALKAVAACLDWS